MLLTTKQAAALIGVDESRIRQLIADKAIEALRFGKAHAILKQSVLDWEAAKTEKRGRKRGSIKAGNIPEKE